MQYEHMADQAIKLVSAISTVNATHASLETFFAQIDELDKNVSGTDSSNRGTRELRWMDAHRLFCS
jgi:hypothetical protein